MNNKYTYLNKKNFSSNPNPNPNPNPNAAELEL